MERIPTTVLFKPNSGQFKSENNKTMEPYTPLSTVQNIYLELIVYSMYAVINLFLCRGFKLFVVLELPQNN